MAEHQSTAESPATDPSTEVVRELDRMQRLATLGTLAGSIAHEFNNILTPVLSYAAAALSNPGDATLTKTALERAAQGAERASRIATAILRFSGDHGDGGAAAADVGEAVRDAMLCLARDPSKDGIASNLELQPGIRAQIDQVALQQVIMNLVMNACTAMRTRPPGRPGQLRIRARSTCNTVLIDVEDTGCGIAPQRLTTIFEPFVRGPGNPTGTGLGLTICKRLVEGAPSGGAISVRSDVATGTCFTVQLPAA